MVKEVRWRELIDDLKDTIPPHELSWLFSEADVEQGNTIVLKLRTGESKLIEGANLIIHYIPGSGAVRSAAVEVLVKADISAREFMAEIYPKLIKEGFEVIVKGDGISVFRRFHVRVTSETLRKIINKACRIIGEECPVIKYEKGVIINEK